MATTPPNNGYKVSTRTYNLGEMVRRAWGPEFSAPDHKIYNWPQGRSFDSTDMGTTGFYKKG